MSRTKKAAPSAAAYRVLTPLHYPADPEHPPATYEELRHPAAGDVVTDIPACSIPWLLEQGLIEPVDPAATQHSLEKEPGE